MAERAGSRDLGRAPGGGDQLMVEGFNAARAAAMRASSVAPTLPPTAPDQVNILNLPLPEEGLTHGALHLIIAWRSLGVTVMRAYVLFISIKLKYQPSCQHLGGAGTMDGPDVLPQSASDTSPSKEEPEQSAPPAQQPFFPRVASLGISSAFGPLVQILFRGFWVGGRVSGLLGLTSRRPAGRQHAERAQPDGRPEHAAERCAAARHSQHECGWHGHPQRQGRAGHRARAQRQRPWQQRRPVAAWCAKPRRHLLHSFAN